MKNKNMNINKMKKISAAVLALAMLPSANAQWAVTNVNDPIYYPAYFGPTGIFTRMVGQMLNGVKGSVDSVRSTQELGIRQQEILQEDTDKRARLAQGQADIARRDFEQMPTIEQCVELTGRGVSSGAARAAMGATGGGSQDKGYRLSQIKTTAQAQATVLQEKQTLGTCIPELAGSAGCSTSPGRFAGGDLNPTGIKGNIDSNGRNPAADIKNFSMGAEAWKVAQKYANDSSFYDAPKVATPEQMQKNPGYAALYTAVRAKLEASHNALIDVARIRREGNVDSSSVAGKVWSDARSEYTTLFPALSYPDKPSLFEILNFNIYKDYMGTQKEEISDPIKLQQELNRKVALANFISWKQYQQQENTNILLSHILTQLTTPVKKDAVDNEHARTMNIK